MPLSILWAFLALLHVACCAPLPTAITKVHVVFMNHLDVGYNGIYPEVGFAFNVINRYFDVYFPSAIETAQQLKKEGGKYSLIYTTHAWLVDLYLSCPPGMNIHCPSAEQQATLLAALRDGTITYHAYPFNVEAEVMDAPLMEFGFHLVRQLDARVRSQNTTVMSQRDVPGTTRAIIPLAVRNGVRALTVGVNSGSAPPAVPKIFLWRDDASDSELIAMWHPGGYGGIGVEDCVTVDGFPEALAFAFRTDNSGPPNADEVKSNIDQIAKEFPNAEVVTSTYDAFVASLEAAMHADAAIQLPVVTEEIGDTWVFGVASDPLKMKWYRRINRMRSLCIERGDCQLEDARFYNFSRLLLKIPEHTWGLPDVQDNANWTNEQFSRAKDGPNYFNCTSAWDEQRDYLRYAVEALHDHPLRAAIESALADPPNPALEDVLPQAKSHPVQPTDVFACAQGMIEISFDRDNGAINHLRNRASGEVWADKDHPLGLFEYHAYSAAAVDESNNQYTYYWPVYPKPNLTEANPQDIRTGGKLEYITRLGPDEFLLVLALPPDLVSDYGAPATVHVHVRVEKRGADARVSFDLLLRDKTATRLPEALFFVFTPRQQQQSHTWWMHKISSYIAPHEVMLNGSHHQHGVWDGAYFAPAPPHHGSRTPHGMRLYSLDVPLLCPGPPTAFPTPLAARAADRTTTMAFNIYNNVWNTNYILWYPYKPDDANLRVSFQMDLYTPARPVMTGAAP